MLHLPLATSSLQFDKVFTITEDLHRESLQFYPVQLIFQVCSSLLLLLNASLVPQVASKMEAYLRKIKKNSDVLFMLGFHLISDKREHVRHHLELQTGWKSFISNTRCGHKFGFLLSQTNRVKRKYLISHVFTGHT